MIRRFGWHSGLALALIWSSWGCGSEGGKRLIYRSFDDEPTPVAGISTELAYSGTSAARVAGPADTLVLRYPLFALSTPRHIRLSARVWVARSYARYPPIVAEVRRGQTAIYSHELRLDEVVKRYNSWVPITTLLQLPRTVEASDELRISLRMNQPDTKVYLDDFTLDNAE